MAILEICDIYKAFGDKVILNALSLSVEENSFVVILGESGIGKTTLLECINGFKTIDSGEIFIHGEKHGKIGGKSREALIILQSNTLFDHLSNYDNILMNKKKNDEINSVIINWAKLFKIEEILNKKAGDCSKGERQRVCLIRSLLVKPEVLMFDEPLSHLDENLRYDICLQFKALQKSTNTTFLYVCHDRHEAELLADRLFIMINGKLVEEKVA